MTKSALFNQEAGDALLLIAYGNDLRCDDGAGARAAALIAAQCPRSRVIICRQLTPELAEDIASAARVVFVDAYVASEAGAPLRVARIFADRARRDATLFHHAAPASLLSLAGRLYDRVPEAWIVAIPAFCLDAGETISSATERRVEQLWALFAGMYRPEHGKGVENDRRRNRTASGAAHR